MSLLTIPLKSGVTSFSATGGTAVSLVGLNSDYRNFQLMLDGSTSVLDRKKIRFSANESTVNGNSPSGYSQSRSEVQVLIPKVLESGAVTYNTATFKLSTDIQTTVEEKKELLAIMTQVIMADESEDFFTDQAVV